MKKVPRGLHSTYKLGEESAWYTSAGTAAQCNIEEVSLEQQTINKNSVPGKSYKIMFFR